MSTSKPGRRGFVALLTGAVAAPAAIAVPAVAATVASPAIAESPELLAIGERLPDIAARFQTAQARRDEAIAAYERLKPAVPPEIIAPDHGCESLTTMECGLDGEPVWHEDGDRRGFWDLYSARKVKAHIILRDISARTKEGRRLRRIARLATKYEKDRKVAIAQCGYREASHALGDLQMELQDDFAKAARDIMPLTMRGIAIYAAIIAVGNGVGIREDGRPCYGCEALGIAMAEAFVAINCGGAA